MWSSIWPLCCVLAYLVLVIAVLQALVCTAAYIIGEFGRLITADITPKDQFKMLNDCFPTATQATKGLLMTAFIKIYLLDPQVCFEPQVSTCRTCLCGHL